jgi:hypothetical protein
VATKLIKPRDIIPVESITDQDAVTLLQKKLNQSINNNDLKELAKALENIPLAII